MKETHTGTGKPKALSNPKILEVYTRLDQGAVHFDDNYRPINDAKGFWESVQEHASLRRGWSMSSALDGILWERPKLQATSGFIAKDPSHFDTTDEEAAEQRITRLLDEVNGDINRFIDLLKDITGDKVTFTTEREATIRDPAFCSDVVTFTFPITAAKILEPVRERDEVLKALEEIEEYFKPRELANEKILNNRETFLESYQQKFSASDADVTPLSQALFMVEEAIDVFKVNPLITIETLEKTFKKALETINPALERIAETGGKMSLPLEARHSHSLTEKLVENCNTFIAMAERTRGRGEE